MTKELVSALHAQQNTSFRLSSLTRVLLVSILTVALLSGVFRYTLPFAIAERWTDWALFLNSNNPRALEVEADRQRLALQIKSSPEQFKNSSTGPGVSRFSAPQLLPSTTHLQNKSKRELTSELEESTNRLLAADPWNAKAFRLAAEVSRDRDTVREYMIAATRRSKRESSAVFWLMDDAYQRGNVNDVVNYADILLRSRRQLAVYVFSYFSQLVETQEGRAAIAASLAKSPPWRPTFFNSLPKIIKRQENAGPLFEALRQAGSPTDKRELNAFVAHLVKEGQVDAAYTAWLAKLPEDQLTSLRYIYNPSFELDPSGARFDWQMARSVNATVEIATLRQAEKSGSKALRINFGVGRTRLGRVSQVIVLGPGQYELSGKFRGKMLAKRGLIWSVSCLGVGGTSLGESSSIVARTDTWLRFSFEFRVPEAHDCVGQTVSLTHTARSASERFVSGEIYFDDIEIKKM